MNLGMFIFIVGGGIQAVRMFVTKNQTSAELFQGTLSMVANTMIVVGLIIYLIFYVANNRVPAMNWRCPKCSGGLPIVKPSGKQFKVANRNALHEIEERGIRIGHVGRSGLIAPEFCPYCGEKLLTLDVKKRKKTPNLKDLKNKDQKS